MRLDLLLVHKELVSSREKAQYAIKKGLVTVNGKTITKPSFDCSEDSLVELIKAPLKYVSKGGLKLERAASIFKLDFNNKVVLDIGASTGGFTDFCLQNGASLIYAVDVGSNQLDPSLINNPQIKSIEHCNFRTVKSEDLDKRIFDFVVIDVSFISLRYIFENLKSFIDEKSTVIALIKPQFELYEVAYQNKGYVIKENDHLITLRRVVSYANEFGLSIKNLTFSPVRGEKKGNIEFLGLFKLDKNNNDIDYETVVNEAHNYFKGERHE